MALSSDISMRIILPAPYYEAQLRYGGSSGYNVVEQYRQAYYEKHKHERWYEDTKFFVHDPEWNHRFLSIQSAHDGNHPVWKVTHIMLRWGAITVAAAGPSLILS